MCSAHISHCIISITRCQKPVRLVPAFVQQVGKRVTFGQADAYTKSPHGGGFTRLAQIVRVADIHEYAA
jgi:hypothetical protein